MTFPSGLFHPKNNSDSVIKINYNVESGDFFTFAVSFVNQQTGVISSAVRSVMTKIAVFLAEGFEEIEALTVVDICRRAGYHVTMVSTQDQDYCQGVHGIAVKTDQRIYDLDFHTLDMLVLPGGRQGMEGLKTCDELMKQLKSFHNQKKFIAAICASPSILGGMGILKDAKACSYPDFEKELTGAEVLREEVVIDGHLITSRGMGTSIAFALAIVASFSGEEKADNLAKTIIYRQTVS
jgi:4-methyl-5(b-hydroxyethyl)-thiazole monophosphate biosynthesis